MLKGKKRVRRVHLPCGVCAALAARYLSHALGEAGADAFTIMKLAGHSSVTVSQRYVHPTPESVELAFERLERLDRKALERTEAVNSPQNTPQKFFARVVSY